jgi:hypothetical protein
MNNERVGIGMNQIGYTSQNDMESNITALGHFKLYFFGRLPLKVANQVVVVGQMCLSLSLDIIDFIVDEYWFAPSTPTFPRQQFLDLTLIALPVQK